MKPINARTLKQVCSLKTDNFSTAWGWIMLDGGEIAIRQQRNGEPVVGGVNIPRRTFDAFVRWYLADQKRNSAAPAATKEE